MTAHVSAEKKQLLKRVEMLITDYPIIAIVNMKGLPGAQLQKMRTQMRSNVELLLVKKRMIKRAIDDVKEKKKGIEGLTAHLDDIPALLFTKQNPFKLYKYIQKSRTKAFAKPGQIAPRDLVIPAGPTQFGPGPILGELGAAGIKAGIEQGKVVIKQDFMAAKKGEAINEKSAGLLAKFNIQPIEIGLNVVAVYEDGSIFTQEILAVDEKQYIENITQAAKWAVNLSVEAGYVTKENRNIFITKAFKDAYALALQQEIYADKVMPQLLAKAERQALSLKQNT